MKQREFKIRITLRADLHDRDLTEQAIRLEIERLLKPSKKASVASISVVERRRMPSLASAQKQFRLAIVGGWALRVPLEPVVIGSRKPLKLATTMGEAVAYHLANGAQMHIDIEDFVVLRLARGNYLAIGTHNGNVVSTRVIGQLVKVSSRK